MNREGQTWRLDRTTHLVLQSERYADSNATAHRTLVLDSTLRDAGSQQKLYEFDEAPWDNPEADEALQRLA